MKSQVCWHWWDINHWFQRIRILLNHTNLAEDRVELTTERWLASSLVTGKRQKVLLPLTLYLLVLVAFLIRDIVLYSELYCLLVSLCYCNLGVLFCKLHTPERVCVFIFNYKSLFRQCFSTTEMGTDMAVKWWNAEN